ncbi:LysR family transcriptional regulator [Chromobacterium haemolyticum]|uniref:LysR family transcriptional regulator n=1 Tax=Chromobacterium haemolyticum TaxID=394935 RepID=UPI0009DA3A4B|nr:LysR family transcriptional regulator [Chromobacterium haemolyticum]OQS36185.1 LysR family transcriptional regulator [Chromobacterium haemolyticum]
MEKMSGIELFAHIAQQGSLVAAGRQLGISASAAGKGLARLEARLGVRLVQRSTRRLTLTTAGEQYLQRCLRILDEVEAAERELQQGQAAPRGRLKVGLPHECGVLAPHLAGFMQSYPEIELDLDYSDRLVDVIGEGFDVVIRGGEPGDSRLSARRLGAYRMRLVAAPAYFARCGEPASPTDLARHRCLHYRYPRSGKLAPWPLTGVDAQTLPVNACGNTGDALIQLAEQGAGIACLPDFTVRRQLAEGRLQALPEAWAERSGTLYLLWPSAPYLPPRLRAFIDFFAERGFPGG